jgi:hypothetical protein
MYTSSIIMLLSWPVMILLSWFAVKFALNLFEKKQAKTESQAGKKS